MEHLTAFIADCDRRTEAAKRRLTETQEELSAEVQTKANAVHELAEQIGKKLAAAEALGAQGEVEESMLLMGEIEELRQKKSRAEHEYRSSIPASSYQQQKLRVCEVCSAYLGIHDNDVRLADHFGGKLHLGKFSKTNIFRSADIFQIMLMTHLMNFQDSYKFERSSSSWRRQPDHARRKFVAKATVRTRVEMIVVDSLEHVS